MVDLTQYRVKDIYTGKLIHAKTPQELGEWVINNTATKSDALLEGVAKLVAALENVEEYKWHAAVNGLEITEKAKKRRNKK